MPNPTLTNWLAHYADAADDFERRQAEWALHGRIDRIPPMRPSSMHFTVETETGVLLDGEGNYLGRLTELSPYDCRMLGLDQGVAVPRRNPDLTLPGGSRTLPAFFLRDGRPIANGSHLPVGAEPGTPVVDGDGRVVGIIGLNAANRVTVMRDASVRGLMEEAQRAGEAAALAAAEPEPMAPDGDSIIRAVNEGMARVNANTARLREQQAPTLRLGNLNLTPATEAIQNIAANMAVSTTAVHEAMQAMAANVPPSLEDAEAHARLAPVEDPDGAVAHRVQRELFEEHSGSAGDALTRAEAIYGLNSSDRTLTVRAHRQTEPTAASVNASKGAIKQFLRAGYGIQLHPMALTAITAMVAVFTRKATKPLLDKIKDREDQVDYEREVQARQQAQINELRGDLRVLHGRLEEAQQAPGTAARIRAAEAAAAARAWKETPVTDSVAKRDSFMLLLDTLGELAQ